MRILGLACASLLACGTDPATSSAPTTGTSADAASDTATTTDVAATTDATSSTESTTSTTTSATTDLATTTGDPPPRPFCCGCLCADPTWSCSADTCVDIDGKAVALAPEAGFLAVPAHEFTYRDAKGVQVAHAAEARHWYVFQPADDAPETRPLLVFFNGGPGSSTAVLFGLNTAPVTADIDIAGPAIIADNQHSWTSFANLLYVDPRESGYSYDMDAPNVAPFLPEHDAADITQFILAFLARHPQIVAAPVVLVGESYGGLRASLIGQFIHYPDTLVDGFYYTNLQLRAAIEAHSDLLGPGGLAQQFSARVLIQPVISAMGMITPISEAVELLQCLDNFDFDTYQCDRPNGWPQLRVDAVHAALTDPATLAAMTGVDVTTIEWMHAEARAGAEPRKWDGVDDSALRAVFGELAPGEVYYVPMFTRGVAYQFVHPRYDLPFLNSLPRVRTFITDSRKDLQIYTPDFPAIIAAHVEYITAAVYDAGAVEGSERPGRIHVTYAPDLGLADPTYTIRFPRYELAGHMATHRAGPELGADIEAWLAAP